MGSTCLLYTSLVVDGAGVHQVGVVFCVIGFHVSDVLEEVSVILPFLHSNVGGEIVGVRDNLQGDALGGQGVHDLSLIHIWCFIIFLLAGSTPSARAGRVAVARLTHRIWTASRGASQFSAVARNRVRISAILPTSRNWMTCLLYTSRCV